MAMSFEMAPKREPNIQGLGVWERFGTGEAGYRKLGATPRARPLAQRRRDG
jgi:hypothetical protein